MRRAYLDGMRGLTALYVVVYHLYISFILPHIAPASAERFVALTYGPTAVVVFIVLCGYCLGLSAQTRWMGMAAFLKRRAIRLLPPYYACLALSILAGAATYPQIVTHILLIDNWRHEWEIKANYVLWSVATEWQLYLFFPLLLMVQKRVNTLRFFMTALALSIGLIAVCVSAHVALSARPWFLLFLALGMALNNSAAKRAPLWLLWTPVVLFLLTEILAPTGATYGNWGRVVVRDSMAALVSAAIIAACEHGYGIRQLLETKPVVRLGEFSYSLYLIHVPVLFVVARYAPHAIIYLGLPCAIAAAYGFHIAFERPFLKSRTRKEAPVPQ